MASKPGLVQHLQDGFTTFGNYRTACGCVVSKDSIQESVSDVDCFYCNQEWERKEEHRFQRMKEVQQKHQTESEALLSDAQAAEARIREVQAKLEAERSGKPETNGAGLSFERWKVAAGVSEETLRKAWQDNEDPADWRSFIENECRP